MNKIIVIYTFSPFPSGDANANRIYAMALSMENAGYKVIVLTNTLVNEPNPTITLVTTSASTKIKRTNTISDIRNLFNIVHPFSYHLYYQVFSRCLPSSF